MMDDIEKTKPVDEAPADDDETGAGCDVCMPPIALVGAEDYDYKYLCMPSMVRARVRPSTCERGDGVGSVRHRRDASLPRRLLRLLRLLPGFALLGRLVALLLLGLATGARTPKVAAGARFRRHWQNVRRPI